MLLKATALVEREQQRSALTELVCGPGGATAMIVGEAGAGKTALLAEALRETPTGVGVWRGQCEPLAVPAPFSALFEMLPSVPAELADEIRTSVDVVGVYSSILAIMRRRPIVLVLDDLQWADAATAGLARYIARRLAGTPSTMICALRHEELDGDREVVDVLAELARVSTRIELPPLSEAAVEGLITATAPDRIADTTAGVQPSRTPVPPRPRQPRRGRRSLPPVPPSGPRLNERGGDLAAVDGLEVLSPRALPESTRATVAAGIVGSKGGPGPGVGRQPKRSGTTTRRPASGLGSSRARCP